MKHTRVSSLPRVRSTARFPVGHCFRTALVKIHFAHNALLAGKCRLRRANCQRLWKQPPLECEQPRELPCDRPTHKLYIVGSRDSAGLPRCAERLEIFSHLDLPTTKRPTKRGAMPDGVTDSLAVSKQFDTMRCGRGFWSTDCI